MTVKDSTTMTYTAPWRAMPWKEFRENVRWALLALLLLSVGMVVGMRQVSLGQGLWHYNSESLTSSVFIPTTVFGSAAAAVLLGIMQTFPQRRADSWALLVHRPVTRTWLFAAKAVTGLTLYLAAALLPLLGAALWASVPGHVAMPFDWRLALPGLADILAGACFYFAGMIIGLRPARWYGSRLLVLGMPIATSIAVIGLANEFWQALLYIAIGSAITAAAAWGSFVADAGSERVPRIARFATASSIYVGLLFVGAIGISLVAALLEPRYTDYRSSSYYILPDATVILATTQGARVISITDPGGKPIDRYKDLTGSEQLNQLAANNAVVAISVDPKDVTLRTRAESYRNSNRYFVNLQDPSAGYSSEVWYYVYRDRELVGYDTRSAGRIGAIGPDAFASGDSDVAKRFDDRTVPSSSRNFTAETVLFSPSTVYEPRLEERRVATLFQAPSRETVHDAVESHWVYQSTGAVTSNRRFVAATTDKGIYIVPLGMAAAPADRPETAAAVISIPLSHDPKQYGRVAIMALSDAGYAIRYSPSWWVEAEAAGLPDYVAKVSPGGQVIGEQTLPPIELPQRDEDVPAQIAGAVSPPAGLLLAGVVRELTDHAFSIRRAAQDPTIQRIIVLSIADALLCAAVAFGLTRRYAFSRAGQIGWTLAVFLLGPAGLLTFLSTHQWPALERCPSCGRKRVVTREICEHCAAGFPPPATDGTEILVA